MSGTSGVPARVKTGYAKSVRRVGRGLTRAHLLPRTAPPRHNRARHWLYSLPLVHDIDALVGLDVPWWTYGAIDRVDRWLAERGGAVRVLEYGSGASTVWLARRAAQVDSIEHDRGFAEVVTTLVSVHAGARVHCVPAVPSSNPSTASGKRGFAALDFSAYASAVDHLDGPFDLVVIDGRARAACLRHALPHLAPDAVVVFDNSWRRRYRDTIEGCGLREQVLRGLVPTLPYPDQTSLLTRGSGRS